MPERPRQNPLDVPLEEAVAEAVDEELTSGIVYVIDRRDLARRAALDGFRQGIALAAKIVAEMAATRIASCFARPSAKS